MFFHLTVIFSVLCSSIIGQLHPTKPAQYQQLPKLRERARIQDEWRDERIAGIPSLLRKYDIDAWLVGYEYTVLYRFGLGREHMMMGR